MPRADPGESFAMTASAASETPAAATATADDAASVNQSEASSLPADGLVAHGLLLLARSHARAAEQAHWRSRLQKKEQGDEKAKSGRTSSHNNKTASTADGASTAGTSAGAMGTARRARGANGDDSGAAAELWPRSTHVSALSSPPPSPPRKGPSKPPSHSQTSTDALEDSVRTAFASYLFLYVRVHVLLNSFSGVVIEHVNMNIILGKCTPETLRRHCLTAFSFFFFLF